MSTNELICLSSEDEDNQRDKIKNVKKSSVDGNCSKSHTDISRKRISPIEVKSPKAKRIHLNSSVKTKVENTENDEPIEIIEVIIKKKSPTKLSSLLFDDADEEEDDAAVSNIYHTQTSSRRTSESKPMLVVKEKHPVHATTGRQDIFSMFLSQCLQRDRSADMRKIVEKLKRKYEQLDPTYAQSEEFADLLNEKRHCLMYENGQVYKHIADINSVMKLRKFNKNKEPSSSKQSNVNKLHNVDKEEDDKEEEEEETEDHEMIRKRNAKIRAIEKVMKIVEKRIKKYEEAEVDFDDDTSSNFLITERYKKRMVDLYAKWCELTNNHQDVGRSCLRPIYLKLTGIVTVDQTINSFINSKLNQRKNPRNKFPTSSCIFPDYVDIFNLVHAHNTQQNLGMDAKFERSIAKDAFIKLGEYLKCERQRDLYDTFSLMYEQGSDPAAKDDNLMTRLRENQEIGEKKLNAIFDEYSKKQDEIKSKSLDNDEEDSDVDDEGEREEMEEDHDYYMKDSDSISLHDSDTTIHDSDHSNDDETIIIDEIKVKCNSTTKHHEIVTLDKETELEVDGDKKIEEIPMASLNINHPVVQDNNIVEVSTSNDEIKVNNDIKISLAPSPINNANADKNLVQAIVDGDNDKPLNVEDATAVLNEENCEEEKPILKLRSFAKTPGFWQQESEKINSDKKIDTPTKSDSIEIIELDDTDEQQKKPQNKMANSNNRMNNKISNAPVKIIAIPLTSVNNETKIFRRLIRIPTKQIIPTSKSIVNPSKILTIKRSISKKQPNYIPLSAIEIRNQKLTPLSNTESQKSSTSSVVQETQKNIVATNSQVPHTLCINPIGRNIKTYAKKRVRPTMISNVNKVPIVIQNKSVKYLQIKSSSGKVNNPTTLRQINIKKIITPTETVDCNTNTNNSMSSSNFISR